MLESHSARRVFEHSTPSDKSEVVYNSLRFAPRTTTGSVVMSVYDVESYLAQSVQSALSQSYPSIELIAVDDGRFFCFRRSMLSTHTLYATGNRR